MSYRPWPILLANGPLWRRTVVVRDIGQANIAASFRGDRSYHAAWAVPARTLEAKRTRQGAGVHGRTEP